MALAQTIASKPPPHNKIPDSLFIFIIETLSPGADCAMIRAPLGI